MALHDAIACLLPYLARARGQHAARRGAPGTEPVQSHGVLQGEPAADSRDRRAHRPRARGVVRRIPDARSWSPCTGPIGQFEDTARLQHEFLNSRGAILRFDRSAIEIRVVDLQECVRMDVAIAVFVRRALQHMVRLLQEGASPLARARHAGARSRCLRFPRASGGGGCLAPVRCGRLSAGMRDGADGAVALARLRARGERAGGRAVLAPGGRPSAARQPGRVDPARDRSRAPATRAEARAAIVRVYEELAGCLERNEPWVL